MKFTKFTKFILLLVSVVFFLLNGCGGGEEEEEENGENGENEKVIIPAIDSFETLIAGEELTVDTAGEITDIKFNTKWIVVSNPLGIHIYNKERKLRASLTGHQSIVQTIALSEDREGFFFIAAGCSDGTIRIWNADEMETEIDDGKQANKILIFTKDSTEYYRDMNQQLSGIQKLAFSHTDSGFLVSGHEDGEVKLWKPQRLWEDEAEAAPLDTCESHTDPITALTFSNDGTYFASGSKDKKVQIWDPKDCRNVRGYTNEAGEITALIYLPIDEFLKLKGNFLVGGGKDSKITLWHVVPGRLEGKDNVQEFILNKGQEVTALTFLKDRNLLVAGTNTSDIYAWDITDIDSEGKPSGHFQESHQSAITALASLDEGTVLASGSEDGTIHILDVDDHNFIPSQE